MLSHLQCFAVVREEEEKRPMRYTVKYCVQCRRKLSRQSQTPEATAFLQACRAIEGNTARVRDVIIEEEGVCFGCGKTDDVMCYAL
jgi:hypothetical protein